MWYKRVEAAKHTSAIIALWLESKDAHKLALKRKELPPDVTLEESDNLHITLVYLGKSKQLEPKRKLIEETLAAFAKNHKTLNGEISGVGLFHGEEQGDQPLYASYDCADLPTFRQELNDAMKTIGIDLDETHGFTPHITLAYLPQDSITPLIEVPKTDLAFKKVTLCWADDQKHFSLLHS